MSRSPVLSLADLPLDTLHDGPRFTARAAPFAAPLGATRLGGRLVEVPPGKRAWPMHCHHANDEIFVILAGRGSLRLGAESYRVAAGDVAVCPAGGPESAHQLINDGDEPLRYLAISTMNAPDVMEYPDSGKFVVFAGAPPGGDKAKRSFHHIGHSADACDYWDGEA